MDIGREHVHALDTIVDPLVITDLATVVWAPHRHYEAVDELLKLAQVVLLDSVDEPDPAEAVRRATGFLEQAYVVDLAWLRSTPWRERVASIFDPPRYREAVRRIAGVTVRHHPNSTVAAALLSGWLASRLDWEPGSLTLHGDALHGRAKARRQEVEIHLEPVMDMSVPGLVGITIDMDSGRELRASSADRVGSPPRARRATARSRSSPSSARRAASPGSSARESARRCCAIPPTVRRWPRAETMLT